MRMTKKPKQEQEETVNRRVQALQEATDADLRAEWERRNQARLGRANAAIAAEGLQVVGVPIILPDGRIGATWQYTEAQGQ